LLVLTGRNTYTGGTTITAGTLQLGNGATTGSILGNVVNNSVFAINRSDIFTFGGLISGTGSFEQRGTGTTIFTSANTYTGGTTISAGMLQLGNGGASGSIPGNVVDNSVFASNRSDAFTFGGVISGTGTFQQLGTGERQSSPPRTATAGAQRSRPACLM
jgi:fibronectin-binding autotransporter adhesin